MRDDQKRFAEVGASIVVVSRHDAERMREYWRKHRLPFRGVADPEGKTTGRYGQRFKLLKLGRMPAQFIIDCRGDIAFAHYGSSMSDIPANDRMIELMRGLPGCVERK